MIVRVFRATVHNGQQDRFAVFFKETALPLVRSQDGLVAVTACMPRPETSTEFCMVMHWRDVDAIRAFAGDDWQSAHIHPDEAGMVRETHLHHYELLDA